MLISFCLSMITTSSQNLVIDTLANAIAGVNSYHHLPVYGKTSSGDIYGLGLNIRFNDKGKPLPLEFIRINYTKKQVTYKILPGILSANGAFWAATFDQTGKVYVSLNAPVRKVLRFNLKDSIQVEDMGNPFQDGLAWAYSISLGIDGKMYFGGAGTSTNWSSLDPAKSSFDKYGSIDTADEYVLSINADSNYVYAQTGQRNAVRLWSIRKKDQYKKLLAKLPNTTRVGVETREDGIYASISSDTLKGFFKLVNGDTMRVTKMPLAKFMAYEEVNNITKKLPKISADFDAIKSHLFFTTENKAPDSVLISSTDNQVTIQRLFAFPRDAANIYFVGDFYGNYYRYNLNTKTSSLLGSTGYNIYCTLALNDSVMLFGGYPNGYLMKWNRYQPWTTKKVIKGKLIEATDPGANPRILGFWKSQGKPPAGFHHTAQLLLDAYNNIVGAGTVIRIGNAASIGVYNTARDSMYGIDYSAYTGMGHAGIFRWKKLVVYSMNKQLGRYPKLYFYNSLANKMIDSLDLGFEDYGSISVRRNILYGIANDRVYMVDLLKKKLLSTSTFPKKSFKFIYYLSNGTAIVDSKGTLQNSVLRLISLPYHDYLEANGYVYAINGSYIVRIKGLAGK